jgi:hypothetical protein
MGLCCSFLISISDKSHPIRATATTALVLFTHTRHHHANARIRSFSLASPSLILPALSPLHLPSYSFLRCRSYQLSLRCIFLLTHSSGADPISSLFAASPTSLVPAVLLLPALLQSSNNPKMALQSRPSDGKWDIFSCHRYQLTSQAALATQMAAMQAALRPSMLGTTHQDISAAAGHFKTRLNRLSFAKVPTFTWVSVEDTQWSVSQMKRQSTRQLAIALWKDGTINLTKTPETVVPPHARDDIAKAPTPLASPAVARPTSHGRGVVMSSDYGDLPDIEDLMPPPVLVGFASSTKRKATEPAKTRTTSKKPRVEGNKSIRDFFTASNCKHSPQCAKWCS